MNCTGCYVGKNSIEIVLSNCVPLCVFNALFIIIAHYLLLLFVITLSFFHLRNLKCNAPFWFGGLFFFFFLYTLLIFLNPYL